MNLWPASHEWTRDHNPFFFFSFIIHQGQTEKARPTPLFITNFIAFWGDKKKIEGKSKVVGKNADGLFKFFPEKGRNEKKKKEKEKRSSVGPVNVWPVRSIWFPLALTVPENLTRIQWWISLLLHLFLFNDHLLVYFILEFNVFPFFFFKFFEKYFLVKSRWRVSNFKFPKWIVAWPLICHCLKIF